MHPDLEKLAVLQTHDLEAKRLRDQMAALVKQVAALETKAKAAVGQRAVIVDLIAKEEALRRKEESEIADLRVKLDRAKKKLDMTTTTHQLEALEHETAFARSEISRIEDAELESMERGEALDAQLALADAAVAEAAATLARETARATETTAAHHEALRGRYQIPDWLVSNALQIDGDPSTRVGESGPAGGVDAIGSAGVRDRGQTSGDRLVDIVGRQAIAAHEVTGAVKTRDAQFDFRHRIAAAGRASIELQNALAHVP